MKMEERILIISRLFTDVKIRIRNDDRAKPVTIRRFLSLFLIFQATEELYVIETVIICKFPGDTIYCFQGAYGVKVCTLEAAGAGSWGRVSCLLQFLMAYLSLPPTDKMVGGRGQNRKSQFDNPYRSIPGFRQFSPPRAVSRMI